MTNNNAKWLGVPAAASLFVCGILLAGSLGAQPLRMENPPDFAQFVLDKRIEREDYNLRLGPVLVDIVGTFGIEYDDNINTSENNELEDWILQPGVEFGLKWQITETNELDFNLGTEYWYYLSEDDLNKFRNGLGVAPSELSFRMLIGDVVVRFYDQFQYTFDSADSVFVDSETGEVSPEDPDTFSRLRNILGVQSQFFVGENVFSAQLSREDVYSPDDDFDYVNKFEHKVVLNWERALAANFIVGVGTSYAEFDFDEEVNNDGEAFMIGPFFDWKINELFGLFAGIAYNEWDFDSGALTDTTPGGDDDSPDDFSWNVRFSHVLNEVFNHQIEGFRNVRASNTSNFDVVDGIVYTLAYNITSNIRIDGLVGFEETDSSGGLINDDNDRWRAGVSTELVLGPRLTADVGYEYTDKDSDAALQSYDRNRFRILLTYDF